jgi:hypothetical protein
MRWPRTLFLASVNSVLALTTTAFAETPCCGTPAPPPKINVQVCMPNNCYAPGGLFCHKRHCAQPVPQVFNPGTAFVVAPQGFGFAAPAPVVSNYGAAMVPATFGATMVPATYGTPMTFGIAPTGNFGASNFGSARNSLTADDLAQLRSLFGSNGQQQQNQNFGAGNADAASAEDLRKLEARVTAIEGKLDRLRECVDRSLAP